MPLGGEMTTGRVLAFYLAFGWNAAFGSIPHQVTVNDPSGALGADEPAILANLDAAIDDWSRFVESRGKLWIQIEVTEDTTNGRFGGGSTDSIYLEDRGGFHVFEGSGTYKLRTGKSVNNDRPDISIQIQPEFMRTNYWIDPHPDQRTDPVPAGKVDLVTVFAHELGHGFGIEGWLDIKTGNPPTDKGISKYDSYIVMGSSFAPVFVGPTSKSVYGENPPITFFRKYVEGVNLNHDGRIYSAILNPQQNIYHLGRFSPELDEADLSFFSLMAGSWQSAGASETVGWRIRVNALDAAIVKDLGVPLVDHALLLN